MVYVLYVNKFVLAVFGEVGVSHVARVGKLSVESESGSQGVGCLSTLAEFQIIP